MMIRTFFDLALFCKNNDPESADFVQYLQDKYIVDPAFVENIEPWMPLLTLEDLEQLLELLDSDEDIS
jgi:hypothetical protein